jgi:hypothetical protein
MQKQKLKYSGCMLYRLFLPLDLKPVYHPVPESKSCLGCMTLKLKSMELKMELKSKLCPDCMTLKLKSMELKMKLKSKLCPDCMTLKLKSMELKMKLKSKSWAFQETCSWWHSSPCVGRTSLC